MGQFNSNLYTIKTPDGEKKIWGSTVLDDLMKKVELKNAVRITL